MAKQRCDGWTADEEAFIRLHWDWKAKELAKALGRTADAVRMRKVRLLRPLPPPQENRRVKRSAAKYASRALLRRPPREGSRESLHLLLGDEEDEFARAIAKFRARHHRIPSLVEGFRIALSLGWHKP